MDTPPEPDAPSPDWRDSLEPRIRKHIAYCQNYVAQHNHGAPGHLDRVTVDTLAKILDGEEVTITTRYEVTFNGADGVADQLGRIIAKLRGTL